MQSRLSYGEVSLLISDGCSQTNFIPSGSTAQNALGVFTPTIIRGMGYSRTNSQLLSVGPYVSHLILAKARSEP